MRRYNMIGALIVKMDKNAYEIWKKLQRARDSVYDIKSIEIEVILRIILEFKLNCSLKLQI